MPVFRTLPALSLGIALLATAGTAQAATITRTFVVSATSFTPTAPIDPLQGTFTLTWDNSLDYTDHTTGITGAVIGLTPDTPLGFNYDTLLDILEIGGTGDGAAGVSGLTNDYLFAFAGASGTPSPITAFYAVDTFEGNYTAASVSVTADIAEPASLSLLAGALGALGWSRRRGARRK